MNWRRALPFVAVALFLVGCLGPRTGVKNAQNPKAYASIVSLSPSTTEILVSIGGAQYLVGRTANCDRPEGISEVEVVANVKPNYEAIARIDPDLIIYDTMLYSEDDIAKIEELGFETLAYDSNTIEDYADFEYRLASKISQEIMMSGFIDKIYSEVAAAKTNETGNPRTTIMLGSGGIGDYLVMGDSGIHSALIEAAGGNVVGVEGRLFQQMSIEKLIDVDPEVIFADGPESALEILTDPRLQGITAVKERHVYEVEARTLVRIGAKMDVLIKAMNTYLTAKPEAQIEAGE